MRSFSVDDPDALILGCDEVVAPAKVIPVRKGFRLPILGVIALTSTLAFGQIPARTDVADPLSSDRSFEQGLPAFGSSAEVPSRNELH